MAKVTCSSIKLERKPKAYMHTDSGNIAFPMGHFNTAEVLIYSTSGEILKTCSSNWGMFKNDKTNDWVPIYDGDTLKIAFGESNE